MTPLPEHRKSPEEIAELRRQMGLQPPEQPASVNVSSPLPVPTLDPAMDQVLPASDEVVRTTAPYTPMPRGPKPVHSLKKSEQMPVMPNLEQHVTHLQPETPSPRPARQVHSLKKSEQAPIHVSPPSDSPASSKIPHHRHDKQELERMRRLQVIEQQHTPHVADPRLRHLHIGIAIPLYLIALVGLSWLKWDWNFPLWAALACELTALIAGIIIFLRYPTSRHHGAFLAVISAIILIFSILHYFPHLNHGFPPAQPDTSES